jgi:hypothetical protein
VTDASRDAREDANFLLTLDVVLAWERQEVPALSSVDLNLERHARPARSANQ